MSEYKNVKTKLRYIAKCGHEAETSSFEAFRSPTCSKLCAKCSPKKTYTDAQVHEYVSREGCELLRLERIRGYKTITILCSCGHEHTLRFEKFCQGQGRVCPRCARPRGKAHANYNPELSDEDRMNRRDVWENILWRRDVFARDGYACQVCGKDRGGDLVAHHLDSWADFPESRFDINNGVTLCETCHKAFHRTYGFGGNTLAQFESWQQMR